jgi:hypothetical protein
MVNKRQVNDKRKRVLCIGGEGIVICIIIAKFKCMNDREKLLEKEWQALFTGFGDGLF